MADQLRFCVQGGLVVGGLARLPDDPCEYFPGNTGFLTGCNNLKCPHCGETVRSGPPGLIGDDEVWRHAPGLFELSDWASAGYLEQKTPSAGRLYACKCRAWVERTEHALADPDPDPMMGPDLPWRCSGHPRPDLPVEFEGFHLESPNQAAGLVEHLLGGTPPRDFGDAHYRGPVHWLIWTAEYLGNQDSTRELCRHLAEQLDPDNDPALTGRIISFFSAIPTAPFVDRVLVYAEADPAQLCVGYAVPERSFSPSFVDVVEAILARREAEPAKVENTLGRNASALLRKALLVPDRVFSRAEFGRPTALIEEEDRLRSSGSSAQNDEILTKFAATLVEERASLEHRFLKYPSGAKLLDGRDIKWLSDNIVAMEQAAKGRWESVLTCLRYHAAWDPETEHLLVLAVGRLIESSLVSKEAIRDWVSSTGRVHDAWLLPVNGLLE
ncbi:MAG: hypothetical protein KC561_12050 [Myxococcales bacterium]|nr:hypothetical protein [Myxococcales bacterium]